MTTNRQLLGAVFSVILSYGCYCQDARNDIHLTASDDEDYMRFGEGSGEGENGEFGGGVEGSETRNTDDDFDSNLGDSEEELILDDSMSVEFGTDDDREDESGDGNENDSSEKEGLLPLSEIAIYAGVTFAVFVILMILLTGVIYFLQRKRATRSKRPIHQRRKGDNINGDVTHGASNTDYETIMSSSNQPITLEMSQYEKPMVVDKSNLEYEYPINTVRSRGIKSEGSYLYAD